MPKRRSSVHADGRTTGGQGFSFKEARWRPSVRWRRWVYATIIPPESDSSRAVTNPLHSIPDGEIAMPPPLRFYGEAWMDELPAAAPVVLARGCVESGWEWDIYCARSEGAAVTPATTVINKRRDGRRRKTSTTTRREWIKNGHIAATIDGKDTTAATLPHPCLWKSHEANEK